MAPVFIHTMPVINQGGNPAQRTTFRPPWVKDSPDPPPTSNPPWRRPSREEGATSASRTPAPEPNRKQATTPNETPEKRPLTVKTQSKMKAPAAKDGTEASGKSAKPSGLSDGNEASGKRPSTVRTQASSDSRPSKNAAVEKSDPSPARKTSKITIVPSQPAVRENGVAPPPTPPYLPAPPPMPPVAPPAPPPPPLLPDKKPLTAETAAKLDNLKRTPRKRPDWSVMMKEVESGIKLKHVHCNDRSQPLLPQVKAKGQFVFESEKNNLHNVLLQQIQQGVRLKRAPCNDRSKPMLDGLRKFRRQLTIEEQMQKVTEEEPIEPDEMDDIDRVRDDLQSTKQMLALELKNKEHLEKENRGHQLRILNLEEEVEKMKKTQKNIEAVQEKLANVSNYAKSPSKSSSKIAKSPSKIAKSPSKVAKSSSKLLQPIEIQRTHSDVNLDDLDLVEEEINSLKGQVELTRKSAEEYEAKYKEASHQLVTARANLEDAQHKNLMLEKRYKHLLEKKGITEPDTTIASTQTEAATPNQIVLPRDRSRKDARKKPEEEEAVEVEESEEESESEEETEENLEAKREQRKARELKMLTSKLRTCKDKQTVARNERKALKEQLKKLQTSIKEENKKYKVLHKEVDKMAKLMKEAEEDEEEEEEDEEEDEEEESEESEESEEEESDESEESDEEEDDESLPQEKRTCLLNDSIKKNENVLNAVKKGNYLLKANIDHLKDELQKQRELTINLQEDLNSVLAELG